MTLSNSVTVQPQPGFASTLRSLPPTFFNTKTWVTFTPRDTLPASYTRSVASRDGAGARSGSAAPATAIAASMKAAITSLRSRATSRRLAIRAARRVAAPSDALLRRRRIQPQEVIGQLRPLRDQPLGLRRRPALQHVQLPEDRQVSDARPIRKEIRTVAEPHEQLVEASPELVDDRLERQACEPLRERLAPDVPPHQRPDQRTEERGSGNAADDLPRRRVDVGVGPAERHPVPVQRFVGPVLEKALARGDGTVAVEQRRVGFQLIELPQDLRRVEGTLPVDLDDRHLAGLGIPPLEVAGTLRPYEAEGNPLQLERTRDLLDERGDAAAEERRLHRRIVRGSGASGQAGPANRGASEPRGGACGRLRTPANPPSAEADGGRALRYGRAP